MAPGRTGQGVAQAAKGRAAKKPPMTKAEYEAAAQKAWGRVPAAPKPKAKQSADQQLDRLSQRSGNLTRSKTGLSKAEVTKAQELAKKTGRSIRVSQNPSGGYSIKVARPPKTAAQKAAAAAKPARRRAAIGKISEAKASRIVARIDANRPSRRAASGSARRTQNAIKTHRKASDFALAAAARARRSGKREITVAQSLQRAVSNAAKRRR